MRSFRLDEERVQPVPPRQTAAEPDYAQSSFVDDLRLVWAAVVERRLMVAICAGAALLLALAYVWITAPTYSSTAEVLIDPRQQRIFEQEIVPGGMGSSSLGADTFLLDSQVQVILSQSVLRRLIEEKGLHLDPEFVGDGASGGLTSALKGLVNLVLRGPRAAGMQPTTPEEKALEHLRESLEVERRGNTYVLAVSMESENPEKAADLANAITELYMAEINSYTRQKITDVEGMLGGRLEELRAAALASQQRVEAYRAEHGLLSAETMTVVEQQLRDLTQQLGVVAATTNAARARWEEVSKLQGQPVDALLSSGAIDSPLLNTLRQQHATLAAREASLSATLMPRHPSLQAVREAMAAVRADLTREVDRLISRYQVELDIAIANEETIRAQMVEREQAVADTNQASVELRDLQREAESDAAIYQLFLTRSKDAREQVNLPSETVRVISKAFPDYQPTWPSVPIILLAALAVGLAGGLGLALLLHLFGVTPRRAPAGAPLLSAARA